MLDLAFAEEMLQQLKGVIAESLLFGPCGFHLDFAPLLRDDHGVQTGSLSLFIQCPFRVVVNRKCVFQARRATEIGQAQLVKALTGKPVVRIGIDASNNSLRLLFAPDTLLSAFPEADDPSGSEVWSFYNHNSDPVTGFVVSAKQLNPLDITHYPVRRGGRDMPPFVEVNGAKIEKTFFDENVKEAEGYDWSLQQLPPDREHAHCMVCDVTIEQGIAGYESRGGWLCTYCYHHFVKG